MEDKRRTKRISVFLEVKEINHLPMGDTNLLGISETGAKIETPAKYASGDQVDFSFILPEMSKEIHRSGNVIWVLPPLQAEVFSGRLGIQNFLETRKKSYLTIRGIEAPFPDLPRTYAKF